MSSHRSSLPSATRSGRAGRTLAADRLAARRTTLTRLAGGFAAMAVVGATLTLTATPGEATGPVALAAQKGFAGYSANATASPTKFEIYEPAIPLPSQPQAEVSEGYSTVAADTSISRARSSYLWPGGPVGEGFKTITEALGLPPQIGEQGYPVQVNAAHPAGPATDANEPAPGMIQRAAAAQDTARADNGNSTDGETAEDDAPATASPTASPSASPSPAIPVPTLPGLAGVTSGLSPTSASTGSAAPKAAAAAPVLPAPLAALVDVGGFSSISRTTNKTDAFAQARSVASDTLVLGGLVTIGTVKTVANASSDGKTGKGRGVAEYGDIVVAGQRFKYGSDGYQAAGNAVPIPGVPAQGAALLQQIGLKISTPKPVYTIEGDAASTLMPGLVLDFDLTVLRKQAGPGVTLLNTVIDQVPSQAAELKGALRTLAGVSSRVVISLGTSFAGVDTSEAIKPPPPPAAEKPPKATPKAPAAAAGGGGAAAPAVVTAPLPSNALPDTTVPVDAAAPPEAITQVASNTLPGLPPLLSFPGLLLYGGLIGAGVAGFFTRRLGLLALGHAGSCPHGLTSGLPDLRKVT